MSLKCWSGTFENTLSSWLEVWYLHFDLDMVVGLWYTNIQNWVLIWGFGGRWRFLTGVWYLDLDLDMVVGLWYTNVPNIGSQSCFWRCKEHPCPLTPDLRLCWQLEVSYWGLASWSRFEYGSWSLLCPWFEFCLYLVFEGAKNIHVF